MVFVDDKADAINALVAAVQAIQYEMGITPSGIYSDIRVRLDILEARINNPFAPAPNVENPFIIGNDGVTISTGDGYPTENRLPGSLYLRKDGYNNEGLYAMRPDMVWHQIDTDPWTAAGDLDGTIYSQTVIGLQNRPLSSDAPTDTPAGDGYVISWNSILSQWEPQIGFYPFGDLTGNKVNQTISNIQGFPILMGTLDSTTDGYSLIWNNSNSRWEPQRLAVVFDPLNDSNTSNIISNRYYIQSPIDNTKIGILNLSNDSTQLTVGATGDYSTILGGDQNTVISDYGVVVAGLQNNVNDSYGVVVGGYNNNINVGADSGFIGAGFNNTISNSNGSVLSGINNSVDGYSSSIISGVNNINNGNYSIIGSGNSNFVSVNATLAGIFSGQNNTLDDTLSGIFSGQNNEVNNTLSVILSGDNNTIDSEFSAILNGKNNSTDVNYSSILNGHDNSIINVANSFAFIGSGNNNTITNGDGYNSIISGSSNTLQGSYNTILNGRTHNIDGYHNTILGGINNTLNSNYSLINGQSNSVAANYANVTGLLNVINSGTNDFITINGSSNTISTSARHSIIHGQNNNVSDGYTSIFGNNNDVNVGSTYSNISGRFNNISSSYCSILGNDNSLDSDSEYSRIIGNNNVINDISTYSKVSGLTNIINSNSSYSSVHGSNNEITGNYSNMWGSYNVSTENYSTIFGNYGKSIYPGQFVLSTRAIDDITNGSSQYSKVILDGYLAAGGQFDLTPQNNGNNLALEDGKSYDMTIRVLVVNTNGTPTCARFVVDVLAHCESGTLTLDVINTTIANDNGTGWTISLSTSGNELIVRVDSSGVLNRRAVATVDWRELSRL